jgi:hypothetical protein
VFYSFHVTLFRSLSPFHLSLLHSAVHLNFPISVFSSPKLPYIQNPPPKHHSTATAPSPCRLCATVAIHFNPISSFSSFSHLNPTFPQIQIFPPFLFIQRAQIHSWIVPLATVLVSFDFAGGWVELGKGSQTL